ncbi:MAG: hypothetical protein ABSF29_09435 [Tepidisphaeraceae bacterium]|jgi:hypothetical protein
MLQQRHVFPSMPTIGLPESEYSRLVRQADAIGNPFAHEAAKVGQYITLGLDPHLEWSSKVRYFEHALKRHCVPPAVPDEPVWVFYRSLADLVRQYAGREALRLASNEDDLYATRIQMDIPRETIEAEAELFFADLVGAGDKRPDWFSEEDWVQLKLLRDQWI